MTTPGALWESAPDGLALPPTEAHVWRAGLVRDAECVARLAGSLSAEERERSERFRRTADRERFIVGRGVLRSLLGAYLDQAPERVEFSYGRHGKPALAAGAPAFNLSHSRDLALFALVRGSQVGIDLEYLREGVACQRIAERFFSRAEVADLASVPAPLLTRAFFNCWTRKEAYLKARGEGIRADLDSFTVTLRPEAPAALLSSDRGPEETARWQLHVVDPGPGYVGALCVQGDAWTVRCFDWPSDATEMSGA